MSMGVHQDRSVGSRPAPAHEVPLQLLHELTERLPDALRDAAVRAIVAVLREPLLDYLREISMNPDQLPETRAARRFRLFFEERGKAEGLAEGKRAALLTVLEARGLAVSEEQRAVIAACDDAGVLDAWIVSATTAGSTAEVLGRSTRENHST